MQTTPTPVADAFHDLPEPCRLACGVTAHLIDPSHIVPARAWRHRRHDRITNARHTGWYADAGGFETLIGHVYAFAEEPDAEDDDDPPTSYYAVVESDDTDFHYLDPHVYHDPVGAAHAADRMAELIAELDRECDEVRRLALRARSELAEANRVRRDALAILRHARACPADAEPLGPAFARLWRQADAGRRRAFHLVDQHRPPPRSRPFDPKRAATRDECLADAWGDGWECGDHFPPAATENAP